MIDFTDMNVPDFKRYRSLPYKDGGGGGVFTTRLKVFLPITLKSNKGTHSKLGDFS